MRHVPVEPPAFFHRGPPPIARLAFFGVISIALLFADTRYRYLENVRQAVAIVLYPVQRVLIEFPAGKLDPGEAPLACARRELREETGYSARQWARAGLLHPVVSYSTEVIDIWFARGLTAGARHLDEGEFLDVFSASADQLLDWCRSGAVTDAKTLVGALWLQNVLAGAWPLEWQGAPAA